MDGQELLEETSLQVAGVILAEGVPGGVVNTEVPPSSNKTSAGAGTKPGQQGSSRPPTGRSQRQAVQDRESALQTRRTATSSECGTRGAAAGGVDHTNSGPNTKNQKEPALKFLYKTNGAGLPIDDEPTGVKKMDTSWSAEIEANEKAEVVLIQAESGNLNVTAGKTKLAPLFSDWSDY